jgi:hypothetical protein
LKIALIAPPFIAVPPGDYGGTELFVAHLAEGLQQLGVEVVVYANCESTVNAECRGIYEHSDWPIKNPEHAWIRALNHESWAVRDAASQCDIIHVQSAQAITFSRYTECPIVLTLHGPHDDKSVSFILFIRRSITFASVTSRITHHNGAPDAPPTVFCLTGWTSFQTLINTTYCRSRSMFRVRGSNSPSLVTGIFWDAFSAGGIISELLRSGFADHDVNAIGVLEGHAPAVSEFLLAIGLRSDVAAFYSDCFDDGAVLLLIRVNPPRRK